ncbi:MAG: hypothetical protein JWP29_1954 [Rhodoferax sp.]|nr:hypothetical protein [Rhodoferax sp.]
MNDLAVWKAFHRRLECMRVNGRIEVDDLLGLLDIARDVRGLELFANGMVAADHEREAGLTEARSNVVPMVRRQRA